MELEFREAIREEVREFGFVAKERGLREALGRRCAGA